jgi:hypothetical protein
VYPGDQHECDLPKILLVMVLTPNHRQKKWLCLGEKTRFRKRIRHIVSEVLSASMDGMGRSSRDAAHRKAFGPKTKEDPWDVS